MISAVSDPCLSGLSANILPEHAHTRCGAAATHFREAGIDRVSLVDVSSEALPIALFGSAWAGVPSSDRRRQLCAPSPAHRGATLVARKRSVEP